MNAFQDLFHTLRRIMLTATGALERDVDTNRELSLRTSHRLKNGQLMWFGGVKIGRAYVSFHLMPVYVNPSLLDTVSPALLKRMHGKSCFNFKRADTAVLEELAALTRRGYEDFGQRGWCEARRREP